MIGIPEIKGELNLTFEALPEFLNKETEIDGFDGGGKEILGIKLKKANWLPDGVIWATAGIFPEQNVIIKLNQGE